VVLSAALIQVVVGPCWRFGKKKSMLALQLVSRAFVGEEM
jgi:hypothetical protein